MFQIELYLQMFAMDKSSLFLILLWQFLASDEDLSLALVAPHVSLWQQRFSLSKYFLALPKKCVVGDGVVRNEWGVCILSNLWFTVILVLM